jgi:phosphoribosylformylglycinamidine synthase
LTKNGKHYGYASNDSDYIKFNDLKMSAITAISNASRHLICAGIRPEIATGFLSIHEDNTPEKGSFLSGIKSAGKHLNITLDNFAFEFTKNQPSGSFFVMGRRIIDSDFPIHFQSPYQYISIIGSHRGELGGSKYLDLLNMNDWGRRPSVDLSMESRIQEVVLTAINGQLIQSARPVGKGGIATTIAKLFPKNSELGARIHFSTKLSTPELLFGETQGLVIVTINEVDLMEFERICMSIGVPSTTIGRLTNDGIYTFNESIKIQVEKLINS